MKTTTRGQRKGVNGCGREDQVSSKDFTASFVGMRTARATQTTAPRATRTLVNISLSFRVVYSDFDTITTNGKARLAPLGLIYHLPGHDDDDDWMESITAFANPTLLSLANAPVEGPMSPYAPHVPIRYAVQHTYRNR